MRARIHPLLLLQSQLTDVAATADPRLETGSKSHKIHLKRRRDIFQSSNKINGAKWKFLCPDETTNELIQIIFAD